MKSNLIIFIALLLLSSCSAAGDDNLDGDKDIDGSNPDGDMIPDGDSDENPNAADGDLMSDEDSDQSDPPNDLHGLPSGTAPVQHSGHIVSTLPEAVAALEEEPDLIRLNFSLPVGPDSKVQVFREKIRMETSQLEWRDGNKSLQLKPKKDGGIGVYEVLYEISTSEGSDSGYFFFYVELREYDGNPIDSILKFRENSISGPQYTSLEDYQLQIDGLVDEPKDWSYKELIQRPSVKNIYTLSCVESWTAKVLWEGISLKDLLAESKPLASAKTVIFHSLDEYTSSVPLSYVEEKNSLIAFKMNGITLPALRGFPFQLMATDKWGFKWAKWIVRIELSDNENYRGYWESRGYNNDGSLDGPISEFRNSSFNPLINCGSF